MEETQDNSSYEVVPQEQENHEQSNSGQQDQEQRENPQDRNWRELNRAKKELEREVKMQRDMNEKLMQMHLANQPAQAKEVDEFDAIGDDEYIPKGKVAALVEKKARKLAEESARNEVERYFNQQKQSQYMDTLKRQFSDFDDVVNDETISILETEEPELAKLIGSSKDPYQMGLQTYKYIKSMGLQSKVPDSRREKEVERRLEKNSKTIQSPQVHDKRPMAQAFRMSETEKSSLYAEMMGFAKGASAVPEMR